ncbi:DUF6588 family protein [Lutibacter sp.]|uniref:DUF6588 family protein n=1 Tax=Lutibacter sp. TaxID=1925666 RepID=UPI0035659808
MKKLTVLLFIVFLNFSAKSQELEILLLANDDASLLLKNYMSPAMIGMQNGLNNGWYHTAKTHKKFGFDITIQANAAITPTNQRAFTFNANDYKYLSIDSGSNTINTIMGGENTTKISVRVPEANDYKVASFTMPDGFGEDTENAVPSPMVQASIGLLPNTDVSVRYLPEINSDDISGNLIGFGVKHNLMKYFGPLDKLPLNIAVLGGFTKMNATYNVQNSSGLEGSNQEAVFELDVYTVQAIASLDFPVITIYGGFGYDKGSSSLKLNGTYELEYTIESSNNTVTESVTDPINMDFDSTGMRATLGARLNLGFFKIFGDYSIKEYNTATAGIAFSFR